jgi:hypothetical protein
VSDELEELEEKEMHRCDTDSVDWDEAPDYCGTHGRSMRWFGVCRDCDRRVYAEWQPSRTHLRDCETGEAPEEREL